MYVHPHGKLVHVADVGRHVLVMDLILHKRMKHMIIWTSANNIDNCRGITPRFLFEPTEHGHGEFVPPPLELR